MAVYKRFKGRKIKPNDPNWDKARWTYEFRLEGQHVIQSVPTARTKAQAERAETQRREEIYSRRYGGGMKIGLTDFVDTHYLPWARTQKASFYDDERRALVLKEFFGNKPMREFTSYDVERLTSSLLGGKTRRNTPRSGATVNRYASLLSGIFARARVERVIDNNPCAGVEKEDEKSRQRYLTRDEEAALLSMLTDDLEFLRDPVTIALGTGLRKRTELLRLKPEHINFTSFSKFCSAGGGSYEILPGWLLVVKPKNGNPRQVPMNAIVREALMRVVEGAKPDQLIYSYQRNGVSESSLRSGFERACARAKIVHGLTNSGGIIWHDLRRTFATRLRDAQVHPYDIMDLLGHTIPGVTSIYARSTPSALEDAVNRLMRPRAEVLQFERKAV